MQLNRRYGIKGDDFALIDGENVPTRGDTGLVREK